MVRILPLLAVLLATVPAIAADYALPPGAPGVTDRFDPGIDLDRPTVRIGLGFGPEQVRVAARGGELRLLDGATGRELRRLGGEDRLLVVPEGGLTAAQPEVFRIQLGSFREESAARALADRVRGDFAAPADVTWDAARGVFRVVAGREDDRKALDELLSRLRESAFPDAWVVSEAPAAMEQGGLLAFDRGWRVALEGIASLVVVPERGAEVELDGKAYRGLIEIFLRRAGGLRVVNEIGVETYLRGVVPEELGPAVWPELEALKAQAVAARTYVLANLGQYAAEGFDICDSPRCQVYGGADSEHPMTDRAVSQTRGRLLVHRSRPINAMYTSTCGGYTEDVEKVFPEMDAPYLRGVPVRPSPSRLRRLAIGVRGADLPATVGGSRGVSGPLAIARLVAAEILPAEALDGAWREGAIAAGELEDWTSRLAAAAGIGPASPPARPGRLDRVGIWRWLWARLAMGDPGQGLVAEGDESWVLGGVSDLERLDSTDRLLAAALVARGIVRPRDDGRLDPTGAVTRSDLVDWLAALADRYEVAELTQGVVKSRQRSRLILRRRRTLRGYALSPRPLLLVQAGGSWHWSGKAHLLPGDRVSFIAGPKGELGLLAVAERRSAADDRFSKIYRWTRVREREQLERTLAGVAPVGRLESIRILGRGISGRVSAIEVRGSKGSGRIEGFRLRRALDLPETLFSMEVQHEPDGSIRRVVFTGRGWGHGVGLCQVGAYGMAQRGAGFEEILRHFYTGAELVRARSGK